MSQASLNGTGSVIATMPARPKTRTAGSPIGNRAAGLLIPLLVLTLMTGSKPDPVFLAVNHIVSFGFAVCAGLAVVMGFKKPLFWFIAGGAILLRIGMALNGRLEPVYLAFYLPLMFCIGFKLLRDHRELVYRQLVFIVGVTAVLEVMQIWGVHWTQVWSNQYQFGGFTREAVVFVPVDQLATSNMQYRPVGFAHANNVLSQLLVFFTAYHFGCALARRRIKLLRETAFAVACILSGAKIVAGSLIVFALIGLLFNPMGLRRYVVRLLPLYIAVTLAYFVFFPGPASYNYNVDLLVYNAQARIYDLSRFYDLPFLNNLYDFLGSFSVGFFGHSGADLYKLDPRETIESAGFALERVSGIASIGEYLPGVIAGVLAALIVYFLRYKELRERLHSTMKISLMCLLAILVSPFGGPFLFTSYFWIFAEMAFFPLMGRSFRRS